MPTKVEVLIRDFCFDDMESSVQILQRVSLHLPDRSKMQDIAKNFLKNDRCYACVAEHNGLIIGFGSIFFIERIRGGTAAVIEDIAVHEEWSNKGVGRLIVEKLLNYARSNKCFKVSLVTNDKNVIFYEKIGFKKDMISMKQML
jgi:GNAT superfamily N-acetyltransferase